MHIQEILSLLKDAPFSQAARNILAQLNAQTVDTASILAAVHLMKGEYRALEIQYRTVENLLASIHQRSYQIHYSIIQSQALLAPIRRVPDDLPLQIFVAAKALGPATMMAIMGTCRR
ncbi:hypothetical protein M422DRAFT_248669 [Sphaerobolus stellatus SS14]|nr:hypothetical protein M422DRAFT_248669 [Sphaerobolus stellatus SS14]